MKAISIKQPWGSVICCGLKHVENRSWGLKTLPLRILIHVGASKVPKNFDDQLPKEWVSFLQNAKTMGFLPENKDLPYSSIIGWADIIRCDEPGNNISEIWAQNEFYGLVMENVHIFDNPIVGVKGKLGLFDYPMEEDEMPASHPASFKDIEVIDGCVRLPVNDDLWDNIESNQVNEIQFVLTANKVDLFLLENGEMRSLKEITITNKGRSSTYDLLDDTYIDSYRTQDGEPYIFTSLSGIEGYQWLYINFVFRNKG